jgi:hypothetical protein
LAVPAARPWYSKQELARDAFPSGPWKEANIYYSSINEELKSKMKDKINTIRGLLDELEKEVDFEKEKQSSRNYNALELTGIVKSIIEDLQPFLTTYEVVVYWYLFNKSVLTTGDQYVRASIRSMSSIARSDDEKSPELYYGRLQKAITSLKNKGVIHTAGTSNGDGAFFKISLPDEIPMCQERVLRE